MQEQATGRIEFTPEMRKEYTILVPNMLPVHFELARNVLLQHGYRVELLKNEGHAVVDAGLKYVHNDTCYPALLCIGQMIDALDSGKYDVNRTALMITQTGGGCRASNYIHLLRKALVKAGYAQVPVVSLNLSGLEKNSGFKLTLPMLVKALYALLYGDLLLLLKNQVVPYEKNAGDTQRKVEEWTQKLTEEFRTGKAILHYNRNTDRIIEDFAAIPVVAANKTKVGIVGEIYVKYSTLANNHLEEFLISQGCEVMTPGVLSFMLFKIDNRVEDIGLYGGSRIKKWALQRGMAFITSIETRLLRSLKKSGCFHAPASYARQKELVKGIIGYGCKMGEGWLLTAEMAELIESGFTNVVCAQPFGCLPNHIVGKGMVRKLREVYPEANIVPIDYDPGATQVNQENRIKLMLSMG